MNSVLTPKKELVNGNNKVRNEKKESSSPAVFTYVFKLILLSDTFFLSDYSPSFISNVCFIKTCITFCELLAMHVSVMRFVYM